MKLLSDDLSFKAVVKNTQLGFRVLIDEWYWLLLQPFHSYRIKQLKKEIKIEVDENSKQGLEEKLENLKLSHQKFRELQIQSRLNAYL